MNSSLVTYPTPDPKYVLVVNEGEAREWFGPRLSDEDVYDLLVHSGSWLSRQDRHHHYHLVRNVAGDVFEITNDFNGALAYQRRTAKVAN